jgi:hypothetical protein
MTTRFYWYSRRGDKDSAAEISTEKADKHCRETDAGIHQAFVVQARSVAQALDGARRWLANRADEDEPNVPDDLMLEEREYRPWKTYMTLRVL